MSDHSIRAEFTARYLVESPVAIEQVAGFVAAQADERVFAGGRWRAASAQELRTLHHQAGGAFFVAGETVQARKPRD